MKEVWELPLGTAMLRVGSPAGPPFGYPLDFARGFGKNRAGFLEKREKGRTPVNFGSVKKPALHSLAKTGPPARSKTSNRL